MQLLQLVLITGALILTTLAYGAPVDRIPATAKLTAVTVYQDRAQTVRSTTVVLKPGLRLIAVEGLPTLLQDDSVRVEGTGTARVSIAGIEVKRKFLEQTAEKRARELENEIRNLNRKLAGMDARKSGLTAQKAFFDSIRVAWSDRISKELAIGRPASAELLEAAGFITTGITKAEEQLRDIDDEKKSLKEQIDALRRQKNEATGSLRKESKTVEVTVDVAQEGALTLNLSGVVTKATWEPAYDVRLATDGGSAELTFRAQVRQQTGEDWNNVALTLSTARPASGGAPPELYPWRIQFFRPMPAISYAMPAPPPRPEPMRMLKAAKMADAEENTAAAPIPEAAPADAVFQTAQVAAESTSVNFRIPGTVDVHADNSVQSSIISIEKAIVTTEYVAVPKLSQYVYLSADIINKASYPLLPGQIRIFTGNTFIGTAQMKKVAAGEKFTLPFGTDDQVTVKREELKQHKEAGIFGKNRMGYRYKVVAHNFRKEAQTVVVKDQLPLAGDSDIKVSLEEAVLQPTEKKDDGALIWKLKLAPGEKKEFSYEIVVEYPKDREISGL